MSVNSIDLIPFAVYTILTMLKCL